MRSTSDEADIPRIVPNYELPPELEKIETLRVVVRENVTIVVRHGKFH